MKEKKEFVPIFDKDLLETYLKLQEKNIVEKYGNCVNVITDLFSNIQTIKMLYGIELKVEIPEELHRHIIKEIIVNRNK